MRLPDGYRLLSRGAVRVVVRDDVESVLAPWLLEEPLARPHDATAVDGGRGAAYRATMPGGLRVVVRPYRRGGWLGRFVQRTYLGLTPRPLRELAVTVAARLRGVAAPEVLAARVEGGVLHRGVLVTRELGGMVPIVGALRSAVEAPRRAAFAAAAGRAVGTMHRAGVFHADLNLMNILVTPDSVDGGAVLIDFDRARVESAPLRADARRRNLERLDRSRRKLDPDGRLIDAPLASVFRASYAEILEVPCGH